MTVLNNEELKKNTEKCITELNRIKDEFEKSGWTKGDYEINLIPLFLLKD